MSTHNAPTAPAISSAQQARQALRELIGWCSSLNAAVPRGECGAGRHLGHAACCCIKISIVDQQTRSSLGHRQCRYRISRSDWPLLYREEGAALGVTWPRGLLLHGPPGTGKTMAVHSAAAEFGAVVHTVTADRIIGSFTGQSERQLREAFAEAEAAAAGGKPVVVFLDELDALCPRRTANRPHEARIAAQLLTLLDGAAAMTAAVSVVAATNRPNAIEPALRRPGRLDREILFAPPNAQERGAILAAHAQQLPPAPGVDLSALAAVATGYTGADLAALCRQAAMHALTSGEARDMEQADFEAAMAEIVPSLTRGAEVDVAKVAWEDIGGLEDVKLRLRQAVEWPLMHAPAFVRLGLSPPRGVLLHGPPGCCKTTLARAAVGATAATFLTLSGAQLHSMFVGEGEALLRQTFARARLTSPAIIFIDELDSVAAQRDEADAAGSEAATRLLSALLVEMDGLELAAGILVLAATNRPGAVDAALMRPGRLDVQLYVPPPNAAGRLQVMDIQTRSIPLAADVDLPAIAAATDMFTGAELEGLCREAALSALREDIEGAMEVEGRHFAAALAAMRPALTASALETFASWARI